VYSLVDVFLSVVSWELVVAGIGVCELAGDDDVDSHFLAGVHGGGVNFPDLVAFSSTSC
jgi:hypothetical protein